MIIPYFCTLGGFEVLSNDVPVVTLGRQKLHADNTGGIKMGSASIALFIWSG
jgi:hypothetical protein